MNHLDESVRLATTALAEAENEQSEIDRLDKRLHQLNTMKPAIGQWATLLTQQQEQQSVLSKEESKRDQLQQELETSEKNCQQTKVKLDQAKEQASGLDLTRKQLADIELKVQLFSKMKKQQAEVRQKEGAVKAAQKLLASEEAVQQQSQAAYDEALDQFMKGQAGILARQLTGGEPCSVCGSHDHPAPQPVSDDIPDEKKLESLKAAADRSAVNQSGKQLNTEQTNLAIIKERLQGVKKQLGDVDQALLGAEHTKLQAAVSAGEQADKVCASLSKDITTLEAQIEDLRQDKQQCADAIQLANAALQKISGQREQLADQIDDAYRNDPTQLDSDIQRVAAKRDSLEQAIAVARSQKQEQKQLSAAAKARLEALATQLQQASATANQKRQALSEKILASSFNDENELIAAHLADNRADAVTEKIKQFNEQKSRTDERYKVAREQANGLSRQDEQPLLDVVSEFQTALSEIQQQLANQEQRLENLNNELLIIRQIETEINKLTAEYGILGDLADVANGKGNNSHGVNFHKFILAHILDRVLEVASIRLQQMSNDCYSLSRATERESKKRAFGLELNLYDQHTSKYREVRTLSGGEGFQASLALALGLSDVVQEQSGGVQLDTLLIDEGFGSLSPDALDECVKVLEGIGDKGKLVGVISHVPDLKERIDAKLSVTTSPVGSEAHFIV